MTALWIVMAVLFCFCGSTLVCVGTLFYVIIDDAKEALRTFVWSLVSFAFFGLFMWLALS